MLPRYLGEAIRRTEEGRAAPFVRVLYVALTGTGLVRVWIAAPEPGFVEVMPSQPLESSSPRVYVFFLPGAD